MRCKWLICLDFSPHESRVDEKAHQQTVRSLAGRSMPMQAIPPSDECQAPRDARHIAADESTFCDTTTEIPCLQPEPKAIGCMADPVRTSPLTVSPVMTTLFCLIYMCLRRLLAPLSGINRPEALVQRAEAATIFVARSCLTPSRSIHAPTLKTQLAH